jgi:hypothetical protein
VRRGVAATLLAAALAVPAGADKGVALEFIEDDFGRAQAEAKRRHRPIFVDAWAPW